jgi:hypothetical protein
MKRCQQKKERFRLYIFPPPVATGKGHKTLVIGWRVNNNQKSTAWD